MTGLEQYRKTLKIAEFIENNLESLARVVDGTGDNMAKGSYNKLIVDLKEIYPSSESDALASALISEQCRRQYLKMKAARNASSFSDR